MTLAPGARLGHYQVVGKIGAGGMGEVWRATDTKLGREVALKVLPAEMATDPDRIERFQREARALAALDHPGIVTVHSVEHAEGVHFLTMQLVEGQPLDRIIPADGLPLERIVTIATALAEALAAAHERGIVHRDLKPSNVMVSSDGRVKVLDFGLAKVSEPGTEPEATVSHVLTQAGAVMGTMPYMSPEQVSGRPVDQRTDLFALGVILYEMATGRRPFSGASSAELVSAIMRDTPAGVAEVRADVPPGLARVIARCLEKDARRRIQTARDVGNELADLGRPATASQPAAAAAQDSSAARLQEGFWIAVLPFRYAGTDSDVTALAEGLSEEIVTGLSRFSYLRVRARGSTSTHADHAGDVRAIGKEIGARYLMEGSLRHAGSQLRVAVQLVDATTGTHLWAETYIRPFDPGALFELQDDLVPRVVSTCADHFGVLARSISDAVRGKALDQLSPYEALMRGFGYHHRLTPAEHAEARDALEWAVERAPGNADCWAMLSWIYSHEHAHGFNARPGSLDRALSAARRAVDLAPSNHLAQQALAVVLFFRKEKTGCLSAAERAITLNPLDGSNEAIFLIAFTGDWERGCALIRRAMELNPHHPRWYGLVLGMNEYRLANYRAAVDELVRANAPDVFWTNWLLAAAHGQLGELPAARNALRDLLAQKEDFARSAKELLGTWFEPEMAAHLMDGLHKAGLDVPPPARVEPTAKPAAAVAIAVLPFSDMSATKDQEYLCEGMAEEIMNALVRVDGIRVASRTSAFRARRDSDDLPAIARALAVGHILEGSVRTAGDRLRVTAQLTDAASGYQLWSERFDRDAADVFAVQDEIAAGVVAAVRAHLAPGEHGIRTRRQVSNLEAYRQYLKGRYLRHSRNDHAGALASYEEAVRLDPQHAPSWVGVAEVSVLAAFYGMVPTDRAFAKARQCLAEAARLQGESSEACYVEALACYCERRWHDWEAGRRRALELDPANVQALGSLGMMVATRRRLDEAIVLLDRAREADPLSAFAHAATGVSLLTGGRLDGCVPFFDRALALEPDNTLALWGSGVAAVARRDHGRGLAALERAADRSRRAATLVGMLGWGYAVAGRTGDAEAALAELSARPAAAPAAVSEAWLLAALGRHDDAWDVLARAEQESQGFLCFLGLPAFDAFHGDPRWDSLVERFGLQAPRGAAAGDGARQ